MFIGHFALGTMVKPLAPTLPIWALLVAPQAMDLLFLPLVAVGIEGYTSGPFGHSEINAFYTHSLVGATLIAAVAYCIGVTVWKTRASGVILAILSFSHWIIDPFRTSQRHAMVTRQSGWFSSVGFRVMGF